MYRYIVPMALVITTGCDLSDWLSTHDPACLTEVQTSDGETAEIYNELAVEINSQSGGGATESGLTELLRVDITAVDPGCADLEMTRWHFVTSYQKEAGEDTWYLEDSREKFWTVDVESDEVIGFAGIGEFPGESSYEAPDYSTAVWSEPFSETVLIPAGETVTIAGWTDTTGIIVRDHDYEENGVTGIFGQYLTIDDGGGAPVDVELDGYVRNRNPHMLVY